MTAWIHRIDTVLPDFSFAQEEAMVKMQERARDDRERRVSLVMCLELCSLHLQLSRSEDNLVFHRFGNMSAATILFVLEEILKRSPGKGQERICAVAFGPGLTVEMATVSALHAGSPAGAGVPGVPNS